MPFPDSYVQEAMGYSTGLSTRPANRPSGKPSGTGTSGTTTSGTGTSGATTSGTGASGSGTSSGGATGSNTNTTADQAWIDSLPPDEAVTSPCAESAAAREKECEVVRRRTELQLEKIGCPSFVTPKYNSSGQENPNPNYGATSSGGCGICQQATANQGCGTCQQQQTTSASGCSSGMCNRT